MRECPKISILLPDMRGGGAERMHLPLAESWLAQGYAVEFVLLRKIGDLLPLLPPGVSVIELGASRFRSALFPLVAYLRRSSPDVMLAAMWPLTVIFILAARLSHFSGRIIVSDHVAFSMSPQSNSFLKRLKLRWSIWWAYRYAHACIAVSKGVAHDLSKISKLPIERFSVIYNPAATSQGIIYPVEVNKKNKKYKFILSAGTLKEQKDHKTLINAFAKMKKRKEARLVIIGEGSLRYCLEDLIRELDLGDSVSLPGFVLDTRPYYASADLFVLSSRWEGFGNVIVEALEHGIPVVSTDCHAGPREILQDGVYGRLVPVGNSDALASAIDAALDAEYDPERLRIRSKDFSVERIAAQYLDAMFSGIS